MEISFVDEKWPKTLFEDTEPREEGVHLSAVIKSLMDSSGVGYKGKGFSDMELTAEIGLLWERALSKIMREKYGLRPPQMLTDGIWMSPDGLQFCSALTIGPDPEAVVPIVLEEYKCTWQSSNRSLADNFYYMAQIKSYCHSLDTPLTIMHVFYIMGDYRGSGPLYRKARILFTREELKANWDMIVKHKEEMERRK